LRLSTPEPSDGKRIGNRRSMDEAEAWLTEVAGRVVPPNDTLASSFVAALNDFDAELIDVDIPSRWFEERPSAAEGPAPRHLAGVPLQRKRRGVARRSLRPWAVTGAALLTAATASIVLVSTGGVDHPPAPSSASHGPVLDLALDSTAQSLGRASAIITGGERRGQLSTLDRSAALKLLVQAQGTLSGLPRSPRRDDLERSRRLLERRLAVVPTPDTPAGSEPKRDGPKDRPPKAGKSPAASLSASTKEPKPGPRGESTPSRASESTAQEVAPKPTGEPPPGADSSR
jgi:hypothetical protein